MGYGLGKFYEDEAGINDIGKHLLKKSLEPTSPASSQLIVVPPQDKLY